MIYPHRLDLAEKRFWQCAPCGAWVGCHQNSERYAPLGRLANAEMRAAKIAAHAAFDPIWHAKRREDGIGNGEARDLAYKWLVEQMGISRSKCHIGMFDVEQCRRVVEICRPIAEKLSTRPAVQQGEPL